MSKNKHKLAVSSWLTHHGAMSGGEGWWCPIQPLTAYYNDRHKKKLTCSQLGEVLGLLYRDRRGAQFGSEYLLSAEFIVPEQYMEEWEAFKRESNRKRNEKRRKIRPDNG
jgi:hypothetical protein